MRGQYATWLVLSVLVLATSGCGNEPNPTEELLQTQAQMLRLRANARELVLERAAAYAHQGHSEKEALDFAKKDVTDVANRLGERIKQLQAQKERAASQHQGQSEAFMELMKFGAPKAGGTGPPQMHSEDFEYLMNPGAPPAIAHQATPRNSRQYPTNP